MVTGLNGSITRVNLGVNKVVVCPTLKFVLSI